MNDRANKKVIVDAGHGGNDGGASGNNILEKDYTLKISKYISNRLNQLGIPNELTRNSDETLDQNARIKRIKNLTNLDKDVIIVSNHLNAGGGDGAEIIYALRNTDALSKLIAREFENSGQNVRKYYQRRLPSNPSKDYYYIMRDTPNAEAIIVEYGFLDSSADDVDQLKNNWQKYAEAVVKAIATYANVPYKAVTTSENDYIVKSGDSLWSIAKKFGITVDELKKANNLKSNLLSINQVLTIPKGSSTEDNNDYYIVKKGDSLWKIANQFNTTVDKLKEINKLSTNDLSVGQKLLIKEKTTSTTKNNVYKVKAGDNLYKIANMYSVSVDDIKKANNLNSNLLTINQELIIPQSNTIYTVKSGDTLYSIARKYNTTVTDIVKLNDLSTNNLTIGQKLLIP